MYRFVSKTTSKSGESLKKSYLQHTKGFTSAISAMGKPDYSADLWNLNTKIAEECPIYWSPRTLNSDINCILTYLFLKNTWKKIVLSIWTE